MRRWITKGFRCHAGKVGLYSKRIKGGSLKYLSISIFIHIFIVYEGHFGCSMTNCEVTEAK